MSMIGCFRRVSKRSYDRLLAAPESICEFLEKDGDPQAPEAEAFADLDIDKAWHGIHFLLTGSAWEGEAPLNFLVGGGQEIGEVDVGYGPARGFTSAEVGAIARALREVPPAVLRARYDHSQLNRHEIYPFAPDQWRAADDKEDSPTSFLGDHYERLREFIAQAAQAGEALLVWLC